MALTTGLAALATMKPLYDLGKQISDANNVEKLRALAGEALEHAINARAQTALLQDERNAAVIERDALKRQIEEAERFDEQVENYVRERDRNTGATVYREKGSTGPQGESPYYCPNCFAHKKLSILNPAPTFDSHGWRVTYGCPICKMLTDLHRLQS